MNPINDIQDKITSICNITYKTVEDKPLQLDVFLPSKKLGEEPWHELSKEPTPTLVYYHGGGWVEGDRFSRFLEVLPYLEKGWAVVNVDYRLLDEAYLVDAIGDCLDALNWVGTHASEYKFDPDRIYLSGESAGGHLAMLIGMMNTQDQQKLLSNQSMVNVAGVINWFGISDVKKAVTFWNDAGYTKLINQGWDGSTDEYYRAISPITYASEHSPPVFSVHGDADINVPVDQSLELHQKLKDHGVANQIIVIPGKKHGGFSSSELEMAYQEIWKFLE